MKRIFIIAISALSLTLFSFVAPTGNGVTRIGETLYKVSSTARFTVEEKAQMMKLIQERYKISNLNLSSTCTLDLGSSSAKGVWVVHKKVGPDWVDENVVYTPDAVGAANDPSTIEVNRILDKYARLP